MIFEEIKTLVSEVLPSLPRLNRAVAENQGKEKW